MYVCVCNGITDTQLREAIRNGAYTLRALREQVGVATNCGRCAQCARGILLEEMAERLSSVEGTRQQCPLPVVSSSIARRSA